MSNKSNKSLLVIIAVLLLTNVAVLGYFLWFKKAPDGHHPGGNKDRVGLADMLQKEAGFTDEQVAKYKAMKDKQRETIRPMFDEMRKAKDSLFSQVGGASLSDSMVSIAAEKIAQKQKAIDLQTFNYFRSLRNLCTPEQLPKYDSLVTRVLRGMGQPSWKNDNKKTDKK